MVQIKPIVSRGISDNPPNQIYIEALLFKSLVTAAVDDEDTQSNRRPSPLAVSSVRRR